MPTKGQLSIAARLQGETFVKAPSMIVMLALRTHTGTLLVGSLKLMFDLLLLALPNELAHPNEFGGLF